VPLESGGDVRPEMKDDGVPPFSCRVNDDWFTAEPDRGHAHAIDQFVDQIRGVRGEVCGVDSAVLATRAAFAAVLSVKEGRVVNFREV